MAPGVRRIRPDEGLRLRVLRLGALAAAPWAFGSTLAREQAFSDEVWLERATQGAAGESLVTYVAEDGDRLVGLATGHEEEGRFDLFGMFVEPAARRQGVGAALVDAVIGWAKSRGAGRLYLGVTSTNQSAITFYERYGFRPTGTRQALEHTPSLTVLELVRELEL